MDITNRWNHLSIRKHLTKGINGTIKNPREGAKNYAVDRSLFQSYCESWEGCKDKTLFRSNILLMINGILKIK